MRIKTPRRFDIWISYILNECIPPLLRDQPWFLGPIFKLVCGDKADLFLHFRERVYDLSDQEFTQIYIDCEKAFIQRPTDLNEACIDAILQDAQGPKILEVGCGRGFLAKQLATKAHVTATDIALNMEVLPQHASITYQTCPAEKLPFEDRSFDTVVCSHTLEHVRNLLQAIDELRRVCRGRLIIVVPCERPYRYSFNLHIHFFPYAASLFEWLGKKPNSILKKLSGDWYYREDGGA